EETGIAVPRLKELAWTLTERDWKIVRYVHGLDTPRTGGWKDTAARFKAQGVTVSADHLRHKYAEAMATLKENKTGAERLAADAKVRAEWITPSLLAKLPAVHALILGRTYGIGMHVAADTPEIIRELAAKGHDTLSRNTVGRNALKRGRLLLHDYLLGDKTFTIKVNQFVRRLYFEKRDAELLAAHAKIEPSDLTEARWLMLTKVQREVLEYYYGLNGKGPVRHFPQLAAVLYKNKITPKQLGAGRVGLIRRQALAVLGAHASGLHWLAADAGKTVEDVMRNFGKLAAGEAETLLMDYGIREQRLGHYRDVAREIARRQPSLRKIKINQDKVGHWKQDALQRLKGELPEAKWPVRTIPQPEGSALGKVLAAFSKAELRAGKPWEATLESFFEETFGGRRDLSAIDLGSEDPPHFMMGLAAKARGFIRSAFALRYRFGQAGLDEITPAGEGFQAVERKTWTGLYSGLTPVVTDAELRHRFDVVTANAPQGDVNEYLQEARELLAPGGVLLMRFHRLNTRLGDVLQKRHEAWGWDLQVFPQGLIGYPNSRDNFQYDSLYVLRPKPELRTLGAPEGWPRDYTLPEAVLEPGQTLAATSRALDPEGMPLDLPERRIVKRLGAGLASTVYLVEDPASGERFVEKYFGRIKGEGSLGKSAVGLFYSLTRGAPFGYRHNPFAILAAYKTNVVINDLYHLDRGTDQDFTPRLRYTRYDEATGSYVQAYDYVEGRKIRLDEVRAAKAFLNERYAFLAKRLGFWGLARQTDTRNLNALGNILQTPAGEKVLVDVVPGVPGGVFWLLPLEFPYFVRGLLNGRLFPFADAIDFAKLHRFVDGLAAQEKASPETAAELHRRIDDLRQTVSEWRNAERQYRGAYRLWVLRRLLSKIRDLSWMRRAWGFLIGLPGKGLRAAGRSIRHAALWVWVPAYRHASVMQWLETRIEKGLEHGVIDAGEAHDLRAEIARGPARMLKLLSLYPVYALPNLVKPPGVGTAVNAVSLMAFFSTWNPWFLALVFMDGTYRALVTLAMTWRSPAVYAALFSFVPTLGFVWGPAAELQKEYPRLAAFLLRSYFWKAGAAFPGVDTISSRAMFYARLAGIPLAVNQIFLNVLGGLGALLKRQKPRAAAGEPAPKTELRTQDLGAPDLFEKSEIEEMHERLPLLREGWKHWDAAAKEMLLEPSFLLMLLGIKPGYFKSTFEEAPPLKFFGAVTKAFDERMMVAVPNRDRMNPLAVSLPQAARAFSRNRELLRANGLVLDDRYLDAFDAFAQDPFSYDPSYLEHYIWTLFGQAVKSDAALDAFMGTLSGYPAEDIRDYIRLGGRQLARQGRLGEAMTMHETEFRNVFLWGRKQGSPEAERQRARYRAALYYAYAQFRGFEGFREIAERIGLPADVFTADVPASLKSEMRLETILLDAANVAALQPKELAKKGMSAVEMEGMAPMKIDEAGPALDSVQRMIEDKLTGVKQFLLVLDADSKTARLYLTEPQELGPSNADALSVPALAAQGVSRLQIEGMPAVELASAEALLAGVRKPLQEGMLGQSKILLVVPPKSGTAFLIYRAAVPAPAEKASPGLVEKTFSGSGPGARAIDMVFDRGTLAALEQYDRENGDNVLERLERIVSQHPDLSKLKDGKGNPDLWQPGDYDELVGGQDIKRTVRILFKKPVMIGGEAADAIDITGVLFSDQNLGENFRHIAVIGPEWKMYSDRPESESRATEFSMDRDGKPLLTEGRWAQVGGHGAASAKRKFFRARDILPAQGLRGPLAAAYGEYHVKQAAGKDIQKDGLKLGVFVSLRRKDSPGRFDEPLKKMIHGFYEEYVRRRARVPPGVPMSLDDLLRRAMAQPLDMAQDRRDQVEIASHYDFASLYQRYGREIRGLIDKELYPEQPHWGNVTIDMSGKLPTTWHDLGGWRLGNDPDTGPLTREQKFGYTYFVLYKALAAIQGHLYGDVQKPLYINQIVDPYTEFLKGFFHDQLRNPLFKRSDLGFGENNEPEAMGKVLYNPRFDERYRVLRPLEPPIHERRDAPFVPLLRQMFGFDAASKTELRSGEIVVHTVRSDPDYIDRVNRFLGSPEHPIVLKGGYSLEALEKILRGRERVQVHALRMLEEPESQYDHFHPYVDRPSSEEAIVAETLRGLKDGTIAYEESTGRFYMVFDNSMGRQTEPNMRWVVFDRTGNEVLALAPFRIFSRLVDEGKIDRLDRFLGEKEELYRILDEDAGSGARTELRPDAVSLSWSAASAAAASLAAYGGAALGAGAWGAVLGVVPVFFLLRAAYQFFRFQALKAALGSETAKYLAPGAYTHVLEHKDYPRQVIIAKRGPRAMEAHIAVRMPRLTDAGEGKIYRALARKGFAARTVYAGKVRMENIRIRLTGAAGEDRLLQDKRYPKDQLSVYLQERGIPLNTFVKSHPGLRDQVTRDFLDFIRAMWREGFVDLDIGFRNYMVRLDAEGRPLKKDGRFVLAVHDFGAIYRRPAAEEDLVRLLAESGGADVARGLLLIAAFTHKREKEIREQLFPHTDLTPAIALLERAERAREGFQGLDAKARYMAVLKSPESRALVLRTLQSMAAEIHAHAELRTSGAEGFLSAGLKEARPELRSSETPNLGGVPSVTFEGDTYELVDEAAQAYWNAGKKFVLKLFDASADPGIPARIQLMQESLKKSGVPGVEYLRAVSVDVQGARRPALQLRFSAADTEDEVRRLFSSKAPARYA
ncbi:MAG TPA: hypothetical protein VL688_07230, partial [Verrucomicrobiae bacterium]|nr:hypothetical protein [Verrucomicrobiae bacterium]